MTDAPPKPTRRRWRPKNRPQSLGYSPLFVALFCSLLAVASGADPTPTARAGIEAISSTAREVLARGLEDSELSGLARFKELEELNFGSGMARKECALTDSGLKTLTELNLKRLRVLDLRFCFKISDAGMRSISALPVERVFLGGCPELTDAGLAELAKSRSLKYLDISGCQGITDEGVLKIASCKTLQTLRIAGCRGLTPAGVMRAKKRYPQLEVVKDDDEWEENWRQFEKK